MDNLLEIANIIYPTIQSCLNLFLDNQIKDFELVGIYILSLLAAKYPGKWISGRIKENITKVPFKSVKLCFLASLVDHIISFDYIAKKLKIETDHVYFLSIIDLFNQLEFFGIKGNKDHFINRSIVNWALNKRPFKLLRYIPSPIEVLKQQARGERVVTIFTNYYELSKKHISKLTYMKGMQLHERDPLDFTIHDLKHMEHFIDPEIYAEQVGFFISISQINQNKPKTFFKEKLFLDEQLWNELEYVISDMNCYSTHLVRYLYAKLFTSIERIYESNVEKLIEIWGKVLYELGMRSWKNLEMKSEICSECEMHVTELQKNIELVILNECDQIFENYANTSHTKEKSSDLELQIFNDSGDICCQGPVIRLRAFNSCMMLILISYKRRKNWTISEAESVRKYFQYIYSLVKK